ncbi:MAG: preprotein translocase subunit SecE [Clostridia bacterium]|nr:preprotein translocase subunit SecE [Clostridia bacterium]
MAENEKKTVAETSAEKKPVKANKAKSDKPSIWKRIGNWFKSVKSEAKKVVWASWKSVRSNSTIVIVAVVIIAAAIGIIDFLFQNAIFGLGTLIN